MNIFHAAIPDSLQNGSFIKRNVISFLFVFSATIFVAGNAVAHGGGLDKNGGHFNRKTGEYHCHRDPCFSQHANSQKATEEADREGRSYSSLYNREDWPHWLDVDHDCQDTRAEMLVIRAKGAVQFKEAQQCHVTTGQWIDPYSGKTYAESSRLDIDHVVPLRWAHGHGGDKWAKERRAQFANDSNNLEVVGKDLNRSKGAKGPDEWMPPRNEYRCQYVIHFDSLVSKYGLSYVVSEKRAIERMKSACR